MSTKMLVTTKLNQQLAMNEQLRQAISLLQYNTIELKQLVQQQLQTNPFLETEEIEHDAIHTDEQDAHENYENERNDFLASHSASLNRVGKKFEGEDALENFSVGKSLREHLYEQTLLCKFNLLEQVIAESIIDAIDENGYLTMTLEEVQFAIDYRNPPDLAEIKHILVIVQTFDPIGIGANNIQECLILQLNNLAQKDETWQIASQILTEQFELLSSGNAKHLQKALRVEQEEYLAALDLIRSLNPKPGLQYSKDIEVTVEPELYIKKVKNEWQVFLSDSILNHVKLNKQYQDLVKQNKKHGSYATLSKELQEAQWLLKGLKRRNETLLSVATYVMQFQKEFLEQGHAYMKSINMLDVAKALDLHESTISRVTTGKYIVTPRGLFELKYFFPSSVMTKSGETCSATAIKAHIKEIISQESAQQRIYSDGEIAAILQEKGINIARRTVAKYREAMKILPSYQRNCKVE